MASSSSSSCKYDVFLSFRGEDTRDNFTSHLYYAFCRKKIQTFIDDEGLKRGDDISPALLNAIECSKISVVIFSKDYASSKWCLNELIKILQCHERNGQIVIPVFYHVDPSDVRKQNGSFGDAFVEHEKHLKDMPEKILKWRAVLTQASNLSGWASKDCRSEAKLVELIISDILKKLENVTTATYLDGFVGLNSKVEEIKSLLCFGSSDIRIIGIWGMGGIGKTTIASVVFNQYSREFEGKCFLANVREESEKCGMINLRKRILSEILEEHIEVETQILHESIMGRLQRLKVLIVLDDVNTCRQLSYLAGGIDHFGPGSRVIITTRDRRVLHNFGVYDTNIYEVRGLNYHDALKLFCNYAFKEKGCPGELSERVLKYANGNPLALKVLGSFFHQKCQLDFERSLECLNQISDPNIYDVLKISYNDLRQEVKSIFLDIACFFVGENREIVTLLLDGVDFGLNILIEKSLITILEPWGKIQMHDVLQEMGRQIVHQECVKEPGKRSRLWNHEDIYRVLKKNKGTDAIEGMFLDLSETRDIHLASRAFVNMPNLRLLKFYVPQFHDASMMSSKVHLDQGLEYIPHELRYLHWHNYPLKSLPSNFDPENLIVLNLPYSKVDKLWKGEKETPKLTIIDLHHSRHLTMIPGTLEIPKITRLCLSDNSLKSLPASIGCLYSLISLNLLGNSLKSLPESIGYLPSLEWLFLCGNNLESLPASIGDLSSLICLYLGGNKLESLPTSIGRLSSLVSLNLDGNNLESLPTSIGCLSSLQSIYLDGNKFESLPSSMKQLLQLQHLGLSDCNMLQSLPELPCRKMTLRARNCQRLQYLSKFPSCPEELDASILETLPRLHSSIWPETDFCFINCSKLNENANDFLEDAQQFFQHKIIALLRPVPEYMGIDKACTLCAPGSKIPDWITYRGLFNSNTIELPFHYGNRNFIGFVVCVVFGGFDARNDRTGAYCDYCFERITPSETQHVRNRCTLFFKHNVFFDSEHTLLGFIPCWDVGLPDGDHSTTVSFQFSISVEVGDPILNFFNIATIEKKVTCCGVCPVYLNANEMKPNSMTLKFGDNIEGECAENRNLDDKAGTSGGYDSIGKSDEEESEPSPKRICKEQSNNTP